MGTHNPIFSQAPRPRAPLAEGELRNPAAPLGAPLVGKHIYAQVIDDAAGKTLAAASTLEKDLRGSLKTGADKAAAAAVGKLIAERALKAGVKDGRLRPRRLPLSWARQGARRGRARRRPEVLMKGI